MHLGMLTGTSDSYLSLLTSRRETAPFGSKFLRSVDFLLTIKIWGNPVSLGPDRHYLFLNAWPPAYTLPHSLTPQPPDSGSLPQHVMAGKTSAPPLCSSSCSKKDPFPQKIQLRILIYLIHLWQHESLLGLPI